MSTNPLAAPQIVTSAPAVQSSPRPAKAPGRASWLLGAGIALSVVVNIVCLYLLLCFELRWQRAMIGLDQLSRNAEKMSAEWNRAADERQSLLKNRGRLVRKKGDR